MQLLRMETQTQSEISGRHCLIGIELDKTVWISDVISVQLLMKELHEELERNEWRQLWPLLSQPLALFLQVF